MLPFHDIVVTEEDELGIDFNSLVDYPAHMRDFIAFGKDAKSRTYFNEEKRTVTGVMISAGTPIYRRSESGEEYYVRFSASVIDIIMRKFFREGFSQNVNLQHDMERVADGVYLFESYIVSNSDPKKPNVPEVFAKQSLRDGSWIASYYISDDEIWQDVKSGKFNGFSVEGYFDLKPVNVTTKKQKHKTNTMKKPSIWEMFKTRVAASENDGGTEDTFAQATTVDNTVLFYEGDLAEGTAVMVELEGEKVPAPEGEHQITLEDGTVKIIVLDAAGVITAVQDVMEEDETELSAQVVEALENAMASMLKGLETRFAAIEQDNLKLRTQLSALEQGSKFVTNGKRGAAEAAPETKSYKKLLR